jgi:hypothetical protein
MTQERSASGRIHFYAPDITLSPLESIEVARQLHELLCETSAMPAAQKKQLARKISGRLFAVEARAILPDESRAFFLRLRTDAHYRATSTRSRAFPNLNRINIGYDSIEDAVRFSI